MQTKIQVLENIKNLKQNTHDLYNKRNIQIDIINQKYLPSIEKAEKEYDDYLAPYREKAIQLAQGQVSVVYNPPKETRVLDTGIELYWPEGGTKDEDVYLLVTWDEILENNNVQLKIQEFKNINTEISDIDNKLDTLTQQKKNLLTKRAGVSNEIISHYKTKLLNYNFPIHTACINPNCDGIAVLGRLLTWERLDA